MALPIPHDLIARLRSARRIAALTGAGISAESGVPTFRDAQTGLWARFRPEELATPEAYARDPKLVWEWYEWRRQLVDRARPNPGHLALVALQRHVPQVTVVTQNVDGLHVDAGSRDVIELHGSLRRNKCFERNHPVNSWLPTDEKPPRCPTCGGLVRPDVVWFGESLPEDALESALAAVGGCDLLLSIGTSSIVEPAASLPHRAIRAGAVVVEINPQVTPLTRAAGFALHGTAGDVLPRLVAAAWPDD